jgi:hypothetical protein
LTDQSVSQFQIWQFAPSIVCHLAVQNRSQFPNIPMSVLARQDSDGGIFGNSAGLTISSPNTSIR